jgi:hypothetical protein
MKIHRRTAAIGPIVAPPKDFRLGALRAVHEKALKGQAKSHGTKWVY